MKKDAKITIVGAGISGLGAASRLISNGFTDVVLLEAKDRVGGRIHTQDFGRGRVNWGAQFIHGTKGNPLTDLAKRERLKIHSAEGSMISSLFRYLKGDFGFDLYGLGDWKVNSKIVSKHFGIMESIFSNRKGMETSESFGGFVTAEYEKQLQKMTPEKRKELEMMLAWHRLLLQTEGANSNLDDMSLVGYTDYKDYGHNDVEVIGGYVQLLNALLKDIPESSIRKNVEVTKVEWDQESNSDNTESPNKPIRITLSNGETLESDCTIFTCSLGILKDRADSLFSPSLGPEKTSAIQNMRFGLVNKIFLEFPAPFWRKNCRAIAIVWPSREEKEAFQLNCLDEAHLTKYGHWYKSLHTFTVQIGQPACLLGWISGEPAAITEELDENTLMEVCVEMLTRFMGVEVPRPNSILRTRWRSDPEVLGSYSYIQAGHMSNDCNVLMKPLPSDDNPRLMFAGEATNNQRQSTADGALSSGYREADRLIQACSK